MRKIIVTLCGLSVAALVGACEAGYYDEPQYAQPDYTYRADGYGYGYGYPVTPPPPVAPLPPGPVFGGPGWVGPHERHEWHERMEHREHERHEHEEHEHHHDDD